VREGQCIFGMSQIIAIGCGKDLKAKEIVKSTKIIHLKLLTKKMFKLLKTKKIINVDDHVINIHRRRMVTRSV
jgi:hypothetical protein